MYNSLENKIKSFEEVEVWLIGPEVFSMTLPILAQYLENNWHTRKFWSLVPRMDAEMA